MSVTHLSYPATHNPAFDYGDHGRAVHFVGSLPPELQADERDAMQWFLDHAADVELTTLPCDRDPRWIITWLDNLVHRPALQPVTTGESTSYDDMPTYRVAPGHVLEPDDVALGRPSEVTTAMAARQRLVSTRDLPPHQVSIPNALDLALFCFGSPKAAYTHLPAFRDAVLTDVLDIHNRWGSDIAFQLETPATLVMFDRTPRQLWPALAHGLARQTVQLISAAPPDARWIVHSCHGDLAHEPLAVPRSLVPAVQFANALHRRLSKFGYPMPPVHIPMCTGTTGPPTDPQFYRALRHLRSGIDVIAGLVDEQHPEDSRTALRVAESELGGRVSAVAAACGLGRRTVTAATDNAALACELAHAPSHHPTS